MALIIKAESNAMELKGRSELSVDVFARPHQRPQVARKSHGKTHNGECQLHGT
ncbi:MAG TPA: hypothetical protein VGH51_13055 [Candidatus Angelobacter sp.]